MNRYSKLGSKPEFDKQVAIKMLEILADQSPLLTTDIVEKLNRDVALTCQLLCLPQVFSATNSGLTGSGYLQGIMNFLVHEEFVSRNIVSARGGAAKQAKAPVCQYAITEMGREVLTNKADFPKIVRVSEQKTERD